RAARGARGHEQMYIELPQIYQELMDAYDEACEEARDRYEHETPRSQWVAGRARWAVCEHLRDVGPAPSHWIPGAPKILVCTACWKSAEADLTHCGLCGCHDHNLTYLSVADPHSPVTLHAAVCDDCYPEGADAPRVNT
ncbi:MAG TPA: hypothetical protein VER10_12945, partial [Mycobacterium sp.]|nr:hypothetical protein [Mycobacterium sp.]